MKMGIYTITNTVNGKMYVGCAVKIYPRWAQHRYHLNVNKHHNSYLQNAWNKYGANAFKFEVLVECEEQFLYSEEHYWCNLLQVHNSSYGYNILPTSPIGVNRLSEETKKKISAAGKGRVFTEEHKKKIGRPGVKKTKESIEKRLLSDTCHAQIVLLSPLGEYIGDFRGGKACATYLGVKMSSISKVLQTNTRVKCCKRHIILYKEDYYSGNYILPTIKNRRMITMSKEDGTVIKHFYCMSEAARELNIPLSTIHYSVKNNSITNGYKFTNMVKSDKYEESR